MDFPNFQEQLEHDLDAVFFNAAAMEFATPHLIGGIRGKPPVELEIVMDHELYKERSAGALENTSLDGVVIFVKKETWKQSFGSITPKVTDAIKLDGKAYQIDAVDDDMGVLELTLSGNRG
jgi:hypothetical protein